MEGTPVLGKSYSILPGRETRSAVSAVVILGRGVLAEVLTLFSHCSGRYRKEMSDPEGLQCCLLDQRMLFSLGHERKKKNLELYDSRLQQLQ